MTDERRYIASPCIRQCTLDDDDRCVGCGRTLDEIRRWSMASIPEQEQILTASEQRLREIKSRRGAR